MGGAPLKSIRSYLRYHKADTLHLVNGEAVAAHDIAFGAGSLNVALNVGQAVVNAVKAAISGFRPTINARPLDKGQHFGGTQVTGVNALVSLPQKDSPPLVGSAIFQVARLRSRSLFRRHSRPTLFAPITAFLAATMARSALVGQSKRATCITQEHHGRGGQGLFAAVTSSHGFHMGHDNTTPTNSKENAHEMAFDCNP